MRRELTIKLLGGGAALALLVGGQIAWGADQRPAVNAQPVAPPRAAAPMSFADIVDRVAPAVVSIEVEGRTEAQSTALPPELMPFQGLPAPFDQLFRNAPRAQPQPFRGAGSGFFISADGYLVTNNHVVERASKISVRLTDGRTLDARLIGRDPATDLAVLKVEGRDFPFVTFEDSAKPRVGDWVVAVGNPFNLGGTATAGIVSALSRPNVSGSSYVDYMQIDAPINRGNSGGPTFDVYGRVVGVNAAIFSPSGGSVGIGFDIPADVAARVSRQLIAEGKVTRGFIGATVQDLTPDVADSLGLPPRSGALVADITPGGPSDQAGLRSGDIVTAIDGTAVHTAAELTRRVAVAKPGGRITLDVRRADQRRTLTITAGERPSEQVLAEGGGEEGGLGLSVAPAPGGGLAIQGVAPGSDAARKGLRPGDVIAKVNGRPANAAADVTTALNQARAAGRHSVLVQIRRNGSALFVPLEVPSASG